MLIAFFGFLSASSAALADVLRPSEAYPVRLGAIIGTVYYEPRGTDACLIATLSAGPDASPVRMIVSLTDGQRTTLSVPRRLGEPASEITFARRGNEVFTVGSESVAGSRSTGAAQR